MATVSTCFRKLKIWMWTLWTVFYMKQIVLLKISFIKLRLKGNQEILIYKAKTSKTGIRLINQNYPFLDGKLSVTKLSFKYKEVLRMRIRICT